MHLKLTLNNAGYCLAKASHAIKGAPTKNIAFGALFGLIQHPKLGYILFDTGYTQRFFEATKNFPNKIYAMATQVMAAPQTEVRNQIATLGIHCSDIKHVILSHFHADHIAGLKDFENATIHCSKTAYEQAKNIPSFLGFTKGILKPLLPKNLSSRVQFIENSGGLPDELFGKKYDIFGDGSIMAVPLPGHAAGQMGIQLSTQKNHYFLVADACWDQRAYKNLDFPNAIVRLFFDSWAQYKQTIFQLHKYHTQHPKTVIVPTHCAQTTELLIQNNLNLDVL